MADKTLTCRDCGSTFVFTQKDQEFFASKGYNQPSRCLNCRSKARAERNPGQPQQTLFEAVCSSCGRTAKLPFTPTGDKPVYCSDCFSKLRAQGEAKPKREMFEVPCARCGQTARVPFDPQGDDVHCSECFEKYGKPERGYYDPGPIFSASRDFGPPRRNSGPLIDRVGNQYTGEIHRMLDNGPSGMKHTNLFGNPDYNKSITGVPFGAGRRGGPKRGPGGDKLHRARR